MTQRKDGGPAFPGEFVKHSAGEVGNDVPITECGEGVSVRDYFAAYALQGFLASLAGADCGFPTPEMLAKDAYEQADAMLAEREKAQ